MLVQVMERIEQILQEWVRQGKGDPREDSKGRVISELTDDMVSSAAGRLHPGALAKKGRGRMRLTAIPSPPWLSCLRFPLLR